MRCWSVFVSIAAVLLFTGCAQPSTHPVPTGGAICDFPVTGAAATRVDPPQSDNVVDEGTVVFTLAFEEGDVEITMDRSAAPCAIASFESLVQQGYFDNTSCHRLVDSGNFLLQCGDPTGTGTGGPGYSFADELTGSEQYTTGTVAMANAGPDTNGSQFFLVYRDSEILPNYTVLGHFGEPGRIVLETIAAEGQDGRNPDGSGRPNNPAVIRSVTSG
jgi:peptidyl-prolyl cis-trans isomerase B (cyclophilin B)